MFVGALDRHEMKSILELMGNSGIGIAFFKGIGIDKFGIEVCYNKIKSTN